VDRRSEGETVGRESCMSSLAANQLLYKLTSCRGHVASFDPLLLVGWWLLSAIATCYQSPLPLHGIDH
jgi:hypothetical protein